jgi:hypothetical protein
MNLESVFVNDELIIGEECYFNHDKYTYKGINAEGKHIICKTTKDSELTQTIIEKPFKPKLPLGLYFKNKRNGNFAELTSYTQMLGKMYYKLTVHEDVFNGYENEDIEELKTKWELLDGNPFVDEDELLENIASIDQEINGYQTEIREIENKSILQLKEKREEFYKLCKHDWYKYDEVEISKNYFEQECQCQICGKVKFNRYNRW